MPPPFFIVGPTAVGKTGIAVEVAARCGAEIVNADAFQLYEGLRLLTAKPTSEQLRRVPHHLVGAIPLTESFSVAQYMQRARSCLDGLARQQRPAIVVGGSGMYVKALTHGLAPLPPAQPALRAELEAMDTDGLLRSLRTLDPVTAARIDARNKRRLIRALEVCLTTGKPFSNFLDQWNLPAQPSRDAGVFLVRERTELNRRIKRRVSEMFASGVIDEVRAIPSPSISDTACRMIGWREIRAHLEVNSTWAVAWSKSKRLPAVTPSVR